MKLKTNDTLKGKLFKYHKSTNHIYIQAFCIGLFSTEINHIENCLIILAFHYWLKTNGIALSQYHILPT